MKIGLYIKKHSLPAKVVKMRFDDTIIKRLLQIAWWDWDIEKINKNLKLITELDVDRLKDACKSS